MEAYEGLNPNHRTSPWGAGLGQVALTYMALWWP